MILVEKMSRCSSSRLIPQATGKNPVLEQDKVEVFGDAFGKEDSQGVVALLVCFHKKLENNILCWNSIYIVDRMP